MNYRPKIHTIKAIPSSSDLDTVIEVDIPIHLPNESEILNTLEKKNFQIVKRITANSDRPYTRHIRSVAKYADMYEAEATVKSMVRTLSPYAIKPGRTRVRLILDNTLRDFGPYYSRIVNFTFPVTLGNGIAPEIVLKPHPKVYGGSTYNNSVWRNEGESEQWMTTIPYTIFYVPGATGNDIFPGIKLPEDRVNKNNYGCKLLELEQMGYSNIETSLVLADY